MGFKFDSKENHWIVWHSKRHPVTGQPISLRRIGFKSEAEARREEKSLFIEVEQKIHGKLVPKWSTFVELYRKSCLDKGMTEKTVENYYICLKAHTFDVWGNRFIDAITTDEIRQLIKEKSKGKSPSHQKNILKFINGVFKHAVELGVLIRNPSPAMKFKAGDKIKRVLTEEQVKILLNKAKEFDWEWYPIVAMALYTGMRNGELYALTWDKVNLDERKMLVDSSWNKIDGFKCTKSGDDRMVEIAPNLLQIMRELKVQSYDRHFVLPRITQWDDGCQAASLRMFLVALGLPEVRFHDLRASWATIMLGKGVEPAKVMVMGGWKDLKTLMIYLRKAGISIRGITNGLDLHNPTIEINNVVKLSGT